MILKQGFRVVWWW